MSTSMHHHLRPVILRAGIGLLLALPIWTIAIQSMRTANTTADAAEQQAIAIKRSVHALQDDLPITREHIDRYRALQQRHVVGPEQRTAWAERLNELQRAHGLFKLEYRFQPRHQLTTHPALMHSPMELHMQLLHEGDLVALFNTLEHTDSAYIRLRRCTLQRLTETADDIPTPTLQADCLLDWITIADDIGRS